MADARADEPIWTSRLVVALIGISAAHVAVVWRWVAAPLGLSHDGRNTSMFGLAARALARDGFLGARGGSVLADGAGDYAHHPPSLVWAMRAATAVIGDDAGVLRIPTLLASLAAVWLLAGLLRDLGVTPLATVVGVVVSVANPIVWIYGWMGDTPMWALPFALAATRAWRRRDWPMCCGWGLLCGLAGWQGILWCALLAVAGWGSRRRTSVALATGTGVGLGATLAWIAWSVPGLSSLADSAGARTGTGEAALGLTEAVSQSARHLVDMWTPVALVIAIPATVLAWRQRSARPVIAVAWLGVVVYAAIFWQAASIHDYWNLWGLVPLGVVTGLAADQLVAARGRLGRVGVLAVAALAVAAAPFGGVDARQELAAGADLGRVVRDARLPDDQPGWIVTALPGSERWVAYTSDRPVIGASTLVELQRNALRHPDWLVLVPCRLAAGDRCGGVGPRATVVFGVAAGPLSDIVPALATEP